MANLVQTYRLQADRRQRLQARLVVMAALFLLAAILSMGIGATYDDSSQAYANIYPAGQEASEDDQSASGTNADDEAAEGEEVLDDEETPLSSGLGGGEPVSGGLGFGPIAIVGIAIVALFFFILMRRLNSSIKDMNGVFK